MEVRGWWSREVVERGNPCLSGQMGVGEVADSDFRGLRLPCHLGFYPVNWGYGNCLNFLSFFAENGQDAS